MLKINGKKHIWIIGVPRSGTTFLTDYLCKYADQCYNEPWGMFEDKLVDKWTFPDSKSIVFKYCMNWKNAKILNERFNKSYFIHLIRNPAQVVYSLVFPKTDSYPYRNIFEDKKTLEDKFRHAITRWFNFIRGSQKVCKQYHSIELTYENLDKQINYLSKFIKIPFSDNLNFKARNDINVNPIKFQKLERLWKSNDYIQEFRKRQEIELVYYRFYKFNDKFYYN